VLLVGAGLLLRTFTALRSVNPGFDPHRVLTLRMLFSGERFAKTDDVQRIVRQGTERVSALPGVETTGVTCCLPLAGGYGLPFIVVGRPLQGQSHGGGRFMMISPEYFSVFKIPMLRGRAFNDQDRSGSPNAVIVNETFAKQYWKEGDPMGQQLMIGKGFG